MKWRIPSIHRLAGLLLSIGAAGTLAACSGDDDDPRQVTLRFRPVVGTEAFSCTATFAGFGTTAANVTINDFKLYVSDVRLVTSGGDEEPVTLTQDGRWQYEGSALVDFEDGTGACAGSPETNLEIRGTVADGDYTAVRFTLGLPFELNHGDAATAPSPLNSTDMFWIWNFGYKFLRIDITPDGADQFFLHLGSTGCNGATFTDPPTSCTEPNRGTFTLSDFDPDADVIVVDARGVFAGNDVTVDNGDEPGCMSSPTDPECPAMFSRLGLPFGANPAGTQVLFRVEAE